jgi:hypothetical protein
VKREREVEDAVCVVGGREAQAGRRVRAEGSVGVRRGSAHKVRVSLASRKKGVPSGRQHTYETFVP